MATFNTMGCDALNVGAYDLSLGIDYLLGKRSAARFPFLSANLTDKHGNLFFEPYVIREVAGMKVGIFGLVDDQLKLDKIPGGHKLAARDPQVVAGEITARLKKEGAGFIVLLTNLEGRPLRKLGLLGLPIDVIIGSDKRNQISLPIVVQDTLVTHLDRGGKSVGRLEVFTRPAALQEGAAGSTLQGQLVGRNLLRNHFEQLRLDIPDHPQIGPLVAAVEKQATEMQKEVRNGDANGTGSGKDCGKAYVGVEVCSSCHPGRYRQWQTTAHARALDTLVARNKQYDEECLACHVLAYECEEGQLEIAGEEQFAHVQCESCHGPGDTHAATGGEQKTRPMGQPGRICLGCHTPERSDDIDFSTMPKRICSELGG